MLKNILAAIGLLVVSRKGYDWYKEFQELKAKAAQVDAQQQAVHGANNDASS